MTILLVLTLYMTYQYINKIIHENKGQITDIINNEKLLAANLMHEIHSQDDAADAGIRDIYMALQHYEEHLHTQKTDSQSKKTNSQS